MAEIQRSRLLAAAAVQFDERGYVNTTVAHITARARVSRRTFYELFANREACLVAILDEMVALVERDLAAAHLHDLSWRERVRSGLRLILLALDRESVLGRVCVVQALQGGGAALAHREAILRRLSVALNEGGREGSADCGRVALTAEGLVGAAFAIVYGRLSRRDPRPLIGLWGELCAMIVLPYLGARVARRERDSVAAPAGRSAASSSREPSHDAVGGTVGTGAGSATTDPLEGVPMRLTYRTLCVLEGVRQHPGSSNRQVADHAGIHDQGQVSKLLARLQRLGLLANTRVGAHVQGASNAWALTPAGERVTNAIRVHDARDLEKKSEKERET